MILRAASPSLNFTAFEDHTQKPWRRWGRARVAAVMVMKYILKSTAPAAVMLLFATAGTLSARAQSDAELAVRVTQMEEQMRHLMGEVEQLNYQVQPNRSPASCAPLASRGASPLYDRVSSNALASFRSRVPNPSVNHS